MCACMPELWVDQWEMHMNARMLCTPGPVGRRAHVMSIRACTCGHAEWEGRVESMQTYHVLRDGVSLPGDVASKLGPGSLCVSAGVVGGCV